MVTVLQNRNSHLNPYTKEIENVQKTRGFGFGWRGGNRARSNLLPDVCNTERDVMLSIPKISVSLVASILVTGALLNLAGNGMFGTSAQKLAQFVTKGYGV